MQLRDNNALITGGASGLGYATAERFIASGTNVMLLDMDAEAVEAAAGRLNARGGRGGRGTAIFLPVDVTDEAAVKGAVAATRSRFGSIHINVNCAGIGGAARTVGKEGAMPLPDFERIVRVNLIGTFNVLRLCAEAMQDNKENGFGERGVIVNTASVAAFDGQTGQTAYAASKGGIVSMTLPLARDLARLGVRVVTIAPGVFETPMLKAAPDEVREPLIAATQFPKRLGEPAEFAAEVVHIIKCVYLNGETIRLDAGIRMPA